MRVKAAAQESVTQAAVVSPTTAIGVAKEDVFGEDMADEICKVPAPTKLGLRCVEKGLGIK